MENYNKDSSLISPISNKNLLHDKNADNNYKYKKEAHILNQFFSNEEPKNNFYHKSLTRKQYNNQNYAHESHFLSSNSNSEISSFKRSRNSLQVMKNRHSEQGRVPSSALSLKKSSVDKSFQRQSISFLKNKLNSVLSPRNGHRKSVRSSRSHLSTIGREPSSINASEFNKMISQSNRNSPLTKITKSLKIIDIILALMVSANIVFALIENELYYNETEKYLENLMEHSQNKEITIQVYRSLEEREITSKENFFRFVNIILVSVLIIFTFVHYYLVLTIKKKEGILSETDGLCSSGLIKYLTLEILVLFWTNPPYINYFFTGTMEGYDFAFSLGGVICIINMFKSYLIIRVYTYFAKWTTETATSLCNNWGVNPGVHFAFKAELKYRPFSILTIIFISVMISFGFALRTFEFFAVSKGTDYTSLKGEGNDQDYLKDFINSIWIIVLTMTTVGYGDFVPNENYGRVICVISCILGMLLVSVIVVSLAIISEFSEEEKKAYSLLKKLNADNNVILKAAEVISALSILRMRAMSKNSKLSERFVYIMKLKQSISVFKDDFKIASSMSLPLDRTFKIINQEIKENYDNLTENIKELKKIGKYTEKIKKSQKDCIATMNKVKQRQLKIGNYLVKLNNKKLKQSINLFDSFSNTSFKQQIT